MKARFPWEVYAPKADNKKDDDFIRTLQLALDQANRVLTENQEKLNKLTHLVKSYTNTILSQNCDLDICVGVLARLKSVDNYDDVVKVLNNYEVEVDEIPYIQ